jgi:hypothetical protein
MTLLRKLPGDLRLGNQDKLAGPSSCTQAERYHQKFCRRSPGPGFISVHCIRWFQSVNLTPARKLCAARLIVKDFQGKSFSIAPESKALYHAAAVMASPHLVALFDLATEMLASCGVSKKSARQILLPLVESTVNNLRAFNSEQALTGTFARGDVATVCRHLNALSRKQLAEALEVYKLLGLRSVQLAKKNKLDPQLLEQIRELLDAANPLHGEGVMGRSKLFRRCP